MTEDNAAVQLRGRTRLLLIVSVVAVPLLFAWVTYFYFPDLAPSATTNEGEFISPPIFVEDLKVEQLKADTWTMIFTGSGSCDDDCRKALYLARQVHTSLGKDQSRVRRVYLSTHSSLEPGFATYLKTEYPNLQIYRVIEQDLDNSLGRVVNGLVLFDLLFLMDPLGNIMMYYEPAKIGKPLQKDLKTLLKLSKIG